MKILFATGIYPPDAGGPATYTRSMARKLIEMGHAVEVVCYAEEEQCVVRSASRVGMMEEGFLVHRVSRSIVLPIRYAVFAWKVFIRSLVMKADIVFLLGSFCEGFPGTIGAMCAGKKTVMKIPGDYAWEVYQSEVKMVSHRPELLDEFIKHQHGGKIGWIERLERWTAKCAKNVIVPSIYLKNIALQWGVLDERLSVIYNAIETMPVGMNRDEARHVFDVEKKRVIFWAGRAVLWKNIDFIIHLLPSLSEDTLLVIAGDGPVLESWKHESILLSIQDRVRFVGRLERKEIGDWLRAADCFVLPSGYEGFPHVIPEAVFEGLPCLVSDRGGNPETHELFGSAVEVLPYLDARAWINALLKERSRIDVSVLQQQALLRLHFESMLKETVSLIEKV